jgi:diguanylate cyclase (GGDEF)-like protein/PAS domain S-box-containing protein
VTDEIEGRSFRWLFDTSADALLIVDRDGRIALANPVAEAIFGYTRAQFSTLHVEDLIPPRFRTRHHQLRAAFFNDPKPRPMTTALKAHAVRADGSEFAVDIKLAPVAQGQVMVSVHDASARHQAEQALRASEEQLRLLFAGMLDYAIVMLDAAGNVVTWNEGAQRLTGYNADEIVGHHFSVFYPTDEINSGRPQQVLATARRDGRYEEQGERVRKDGSSFTAHVTVSALFDDNGELRGFGKITRDITAEHRTRLELEEHRRRLEEMVSRRTSQLERQTELLRGANTNLSREVGERLQAETALRESERRYREIFENASDNVFVVRVLEDGRFQNVDANPAFEKSIGIARADFAARYVEDTVSPETANRVIERFRECVRTAAPLEHEIELDVPAGRRRFRATLMPVVDGNGRVVRIIGMSRDITDKARAEEALRESEERFRLLLESAGEGIYGVDTEGRCTFVNGAALAQLGRAREELVGSGVHELIHHHRADGTPYPASECMLYDAYRRGVASRRVTETVWRKDGSNFLAEFSVQPLLRDNTVVGAVFLFRDITWQHALTHRLTHQATHDALTGLVNRGEFEHRLERAVTDARHGGEHALAYIDLDHFKEINDACGHAAGDELLREVTARLLTRLRSRDTLGRLGGDEFGLLLEHCPPHRALEVANELRDVLADYRFECNGRQFTVGMSLGLVPLRAGAGDMPELLNKADAACYIAKQRGRGCVYMAGSAP